MIVNPATGALLRDPATKLVIADGAEVDPNDPYFARLLADGDLVSAETEAVAPAPAPEDPAPPALPAPVEPAHSSEDAA